MGLIADRMKPVIFQDNADLSPGIPRWKTRPDPFRLFEGYHRDNIEKERVRVKAA
jgi:hypothetical protein